MGCGSSKDGKQPGTIKKIGSPSKQGSSPSRQESPSKAGSKSIKQVSESELQKHKVGDILGFIKSGNIAMVHGLIGYYKLDQAVILLRDFKEEHKLSNTEKIPMNDWNPLLIAIANKKLEIVRYFTQNLNLSVKQWTMNPVVQQEELYIDQQIFGLTLTIGNKDLPMFKELWNIHYTVWEDVHVLPVLQALISAKWVDGIKAFFSSYTTDILYSSQSQDSQIEFLREILKVRKSSSNDIHKVLDELLNKNPYLLALVYIALTDSAEECLTKAEQKVVIEKNYQNIQEFSYAHLKFTQPQVEQVLNDYEARGEVEKATVAKLKEHLASLDEKLAQNDSFSSLDQFQAYNQAFFEAVNTQDLEKVREFAGQLGLRQVPYTDGENSSSGLYEIYSINYQTYWPVTLSILFKDDVHIQEIYGYLISNGFNIRQVLSQTSRRGVLDAREIISVPQALGVSLLLSAETGKENLLQYLLSTEFINVFDVQHFKILVYAVLRFNGPMMRTVLTSPVGTNSFLQMTTSQRFEFVENVYRGSFQSSDALEALASKYYAPYLLLILTERDYFMKLTDFTLYNQAIDNLSILELEQLAKSSDYDERFLAFFRYIDILDVTDPKKTNGQRLIQLIQENQKFRAFLDQTLKILENDSIVQDEPEEEITRKVQNPSINKHSEKTQIKDINIDNLLNCITSNDSQGAINFLSTYRLSDLQFFKGSAQVSLSIYKLHENQRDFIETNVAHSSLNILQIACAYNQLNLVSYILHQHKTFQHSHRQLKETDPRLIIQNYEDSDETLTLRLALQYGSQFIFQHLWQNFGYLFTERHLLVVARFMKFLNLDHKFRDFLYSSTTDEIFKNSPQSIKYEFVQIFNNIDASYQEEVNLILQTNYNNFDRGVNDDILLQIYNVVRDNEVEQLEQIVNNYQISGIAQLHFDFFQEDEEVLNLADDQKITVSFLNPILLSVKSKSFSSLKFLVERFGIRRSMRNIDLVFRHETLGEYGFKNLLLPILLKIKDTDALSYLTNKARDLVLSSQDLTSFISLSLQERWLAGLKTFLISDTALFYFQALSFDEQRLFVERVVKFISDLEDPTQKRQFVANIIEECLTRRPYSKHLVCVLIEGGLKAENSLPKLARECLKNLTSEDLMQLANSDHHALAEYERRFNDIKGDKFENEIAKILLRYANEGRPDHFAPQYVESRKQVRFEEAHENGSVQENRI